MTRSGESILQRRQPQSSKPWLKGMVLAGLCMVALAGRSWAQAPVITEQPVPVTVDSYMPAFFSLTASGAGPLTYQWYKSGAVKLTNDARHIGADTGALQINGADISDISDYYCVVKNGAGSTTSSLAHLTVNPSLRVISPHGSPTPAVGMRSLTSGTQVNSSMAGAPEVDYAGTTRWNCTGYTGTGSAPSGNGLSYSFRLRTNSTITWAWQLQYKVTALSNPPGGGVVTLADKVTTATGQWLNAGASQTYWALPKANYRFGSWSGDASGTVNTVNQTLSKPVNLTANFIMTPTFLMQPVSKGVNDGTTVSFSVQTTATLPITYQWLRFGVKLNDGGSIHGATSNTLTIDSARVANEGQYACRIGDGVTTAVSNSAALTINDPPSFRSQPASRTVNQGSMVIITVSTTGTQPITYQWKKAGVPLTDGGGITGTQTASLQISSAQPAHAGRYTCYISNMAGFAESNPLTLTVKTPPTILKQPDGMTLDPGSTAVFTINTTGTTPMSYQWLRNGVSVRNSSRISGATSTTLRISSVGAADTGNYSCYVSNSVNYVFSQQARLNVNLTLTVASAHGQPWPEVGCHYFTTGTQIAATVGLSPEVDSTGTSRMICNGWLGAGAAPASGVTTQTTFILDQDSTLTWRWKPQHLLTAECDPPNVAHIVMEDWVTTASGLWLDENTEYHVRQWAPNNGWVFNGWGGDIADAGMDSSPTLPMNRPVHVVAHYLRYPEVLTQPTWQYVKSGGTVTLDTVCTGSAPMRYQWYRDGQPLVDDSRVSGSCTPKLQIQCFKPTDAGKYKCDVSNDVGLVSTMEVPLVILYRLHIDAPYGKPYPVGGDHYNLAGTLFVASCGDPIVNAPSGQTRWIWNGWRGQGAVPTQGASDKITFHLDRDTTISWTWRTEHLLSVSGTPAAGGAVTPTSGWLAAGAPVTVKAVPNSLYNFTGWSGSVSAGSPVLKLIMNGPMQLLGHFRYASGTVRIGVSPANMPWVLTDGQNRQHSGAGSAVLRDIPCGTVSLKWLPPANYNAVTPNPRVKTLPKNGEASITEVFVPKSPDSAANAARILRYLLGLSQTTDGLDLNGDGVVNVTDLLKAKGVAAAQAPAAGQ